MNRLLALLFCIGFAHSADGSIDIDAALANQVAQHSLLVKIAESPSDSEFISLVEIITKQVGSTTDPVKLRNSLSFLLKACGASTKISSAVYSRRSNIRALLTDKDPSIRNLALLLLMASARDIKQPDVAIENDFLLAIETYRSETAISLLRTYKVSDQVRLERALLSILRDDPRSAFRVLPELAPFASGPNSEEIQACFQTAIQYDDASIRGAALEFARRLRPITNQVGAALIAIASIPATSASERDSILVAIITSDIQGDFVDPLIKALSAVETAETIFKLAVLSHRNEKYRSPRFRQALLEGQTVSTTDHQDKLKMLWANSR